MLLTRPSLAVEPQVKMLSIELFVKSALPPTPFIIIVPPTFVELTWP